MPNWLSRLFTLPKSKNSLSDIAPKLKISDPVVRDMVLRLTSMYIDTMASQISGQIIYRLPADQQAAASEFLVSQLYDPFRKGVSSVITSGKLP